MADGNARQVDASAGLRSSLARQLRAFLPIERGEALSAVLLAINVFLLLTCYYVLKVLREPMILLGGGAELKAYASAGQTALLLLIVPAFGLIASRVDRIKLLTIVQLFFIACLVAFYALAQARAPIGLAFYLWLGIYGVLVVSNFWAFANDLYTPEQGKRIFPIVGLGGSAGAILGAILPGPLGELVGTYELFLVAAGSLAVSIVLYRWIDQRERLARDDARTVELVKPEAVQPLARHGGFMLVTKDAYLRVMALMVLVAMTANTIGEYVIGKTVATAAQGTVDPGAYIGHFYSSYYAVVNLATALLQGVIVARMLAWIGIRHALLIMPIIALGGWIVFLGSATLMTLRVTKTVENSLDYSLHNTVRHALFLPTSRESKYKAKAAVDTFFFRLGDVVAGLGIVFLLVDVLGLGVRAFAVVNLCLSLLWLVLVVRVGKLHDERTAERAARAAAGLRETAV